MAKSKTDAEQFSESETARRRDEALARALGMPPKPHSESVSGGGRKRKPARPKRND